MFLGIVSVTHRKITCLNSLSRPKSNSATTTPKITENKITAVVNCSVCRRVGQVTWRSSLKLLRIYVGTRMRPRNRPTTLNGFHIRTLPSNLPAARNGVPTVRVTFRTLFDFGCVFVALAARSRIVCGACRKRRGFFWDCRLAIFLPKKITYIGCRSLLSSLAGRARACKRGMKLDAGTACGCARLCNVHMYIGRTCQLTAVMNKALALHIRNFTN